MGIIYSHRSLGFLLSLLLMICSACQNHAASFHAAGRYHVDLSAVPDHLLHEEQVEPRYQPIHKLIRAYASYYQDHGEWPPPLESDLTAPKITLGEQGRTEVYIPQNTAQAIEIQLEGNRISTTTFLPNDPRLKQMSYQVPRQGYDHLGRLQFWEKRKFHLVFVGDSHTAKQIYPQSCIQFLRQSGWFSEVTYQIIARGGATPAQMQTMIRDQHLTPELDQDTIKLAVVLAGTNAYDLKAYQALIKILNFEYGYTVVGMQTPPRLNPGNKKYGFPHANAKFNHALVKLTHDSDALRSGVGELFKPNNSFDFTIPLIIMPIPDQLRDEQKKNETGDWLNPQYAADHTHLTRAGYELLGLELANFIFVRMPRRDLVRVFRDNDETQWFGPHEYEQMMQTKWGPINNDFWDHWTRKPKPIPTAKQ